MSSKDGFLSKLWIICGCLLWTVFFRRTVFFLFFSFFKGTMWCISVVLGYCFVTVPNFIRRWVPHSSATLSLGFLYIFAQALGLMWLLFVSLCSIYSIHIFKFMQSYLSGEAMDTKSVFGSFVRGYVHYCILRILFFIGTSFYQIGWEAFADFPTVRSLVVGRRIRSAAKQKDPQFGNGAIIKSRTAPLLARSPLQETSEEDLTDGSPSARAGDIPKLGRQDSDDSHLSHYVSRDKIEEESATGSQAASSGPRRGKRRQYLREASLMAPLIGLFVCSVAVGGGTVFCQVTQLWPDSVFLESLTSPTGRLNRGVRFALFVSFLQWVQVFFYLFPRWHTGLLSTLFGKIWCGISLPIWPLALYRVTKWSWAPAGTGITQELLGGIPHHVMDLVIILGLKLWMGVACTQVLKQPEMSGFDRRKRMVEDSDWKEMSALFKYWFLVPAIFHFFRGCMKFGFEDAQNDLLIIVCAYPCLLVTVWTIVWAVVISPECKLLVVGCIGGLSMASHLCSLSLFGNAGGATIAVWLHLMRQYFKFKEMRQNKPQSTRDAAHHSDSGAESPGSKWKKAGQSSSLRSQPPPPGRIMARWVIVASAIIALTFFSILASLAVLSSYQKKMNWYPSSIWFEKEKDPPALQVDHSVSRLRLTEASGNATFNTSGVSYSVCGHSWHGLSIIDYGLLSLAAYFDAHDPSLPELLDGIFPKKTDISWRLRNSTKQCPEAAEVASRPGSSGSMLSWLEIELNLPKQEKPLLVVSIRGTDPSKLSDFMEDVRLWTEPVALSILSTVFPTIKAWPRKTVEMVITGIHDFLSLLGMPNDDWSYMGLAHCLSRIDRGQFSGIVLTGHSLGGGMATIVAAMAHLPVVSITPPGIYWSLAKHARLNNNASFAEHAEATDSRWMHHQSLTLIVENDFVNDIFDDHGGLVQMMTCDRSAESLELACHMLEGTICHLWHHCGDPLKRWDSCSHDHYLRDKVKTVATEATMALGKALPHVLPEVSPDIQQRVDWIWESAKLLKMQMFEGDSPILGKTIFGLVLLFVVLPIVGGLLEEYIAS